MPDEAVKTIARALLDQWICVFGPMVRLLSDRGLNFIGKIVEELAALLGIGRLRAYPLHPQANGTVERWNRTLTRDLASFVATGESDWDEHVALACFRYNSGLCEATGMSPNKAMFGVDAFEAWAELDAGREDREPGGLARGLAQLHRSLLGRRRRRVFVPRRIQSGDAETKYEPGDRVLLWSNEVASQEGKKVVSRGLDRMS